jgi:class 3 adenylate cyclase
MASVFAEPWFPFGIGDYTERKPTFHAPYFSSLFRPLGAKATFFIDHRRWSLLAFWGEHLAPISVGSRYAAYVKMYSKMFELLGPLRSKLVREIKRIEEISRREVIRVKSPELEGLQGYAIRAYVIDKFLVLFLDPSSIVHDDYKEAILGALGYIERGLDFFDQIPPQIFAIEFGANERLFERYFGPHAFCPAKEPHVPFLWPWQRSVVGGKKGTTATRQIPTTSLVLDLRNSTTAMGLSRRPEKFSELLTSFTSLAREKIINGGGFFDKEIGDGVVGHFCDEVSLSLDPKGRRNVALLQSLSVSHSIIEGTRSLFKEYRRNLRQGIELFGPAIGLHKDDAVWLYSKSGIRAIGGSVTDATRLCTNARKEEICVSNWFVQELMASYPRKAGFLDDFEQREIKVPEIREAAGAYGYVFKARRGSALLRAWTKSGSERPDRKIS